MEWGKLRDLEELSGASLESSREEQCMCLARAGIARENFHVARERPPWKALLGTGRKEVEAIAFISFFFAQKKLTRHVSKEMVRDFQWVMTNDNDIGC
jgi:hypothetical protein